MTRGDARHPRLTRRGRLVLSLLVLAGAAGGAAAVRALSPDLGSRAVASIAVAKPPGWAPVETDPGRDGAQVLVDDPADLPMAVADRLILRAPVVIVADAPSSAADTLAADLAAPLLPAGAVESGRLDGWGTRTLVVVDDPGVETVGEIDVVRTTAAGEGIDGEHARWLASLRDQAARQAAGAVPGPLLLTRPEDPGRLPDPGLLALAGAETVELGADDPRGEAGLLDVLAEEPDRPVWTVGTTAAWAPVDLGALPWQLDVVRAGQELPGGGQLLFPGRRLVALYGSPGSGALGVLGEQPVEAAIERARDWAARYAEVSDVPIVPAFEIISTIAAAEATPDGDYSRPVPLDVLETWVDAAGEAGLYVVLDLQPGRTDFLTQALTLEPLLRRPHVGLALDPEWRLEPDQVHLRQIGSVTAAEINRVAAWLAELTRTHALPQKLLLLHQFKLSMIQNRASVTVPPELAVVIQMDGQGPQGTKLETWRTLTTQDPPAGVGWGWKNFFDEDPTLRSPVDTLAVEPTPVFVSYQ